METLELPPEEDEDGAAVDAEAKLEEKTAVVKTSSRHTIFLPVIGMVEPEDLSPGDLVGVNKESYLILDKLPPEYDSRVKAMEIDEKPTEDYNDIGRLVGVLEYWVMAAVPVRNLRWVQFPGDDQEGSLVTLRNPDAWGPDVERHARVARMIGTLDEQTRLARVLVTVDDPLGQMSDVPPLILDTLIEVRIQGQPIENVVRVNRDYVHEGSTVWVMKNEKLEVRDTEIVFQDAENAYIGKGLEDGEEIVTTTLSTVADGIGLRKADDASSTLPPTVEEPSE